MNNNRIRFHSAWMMIYALIFFSGCAGLRPGRPDCHDKKAFQLAESVKKINKNIHSCTGIGWLHVSNKGRTDKFRVAWAASAPDKIRLTLMTAGFPVETVIADGKKVIFLSHTGKHSLYKMDLPNPSLMSILSIPVKVRDIISLLSGQIPLKKFDSACLSTVAISGKRMLILNKKWRGTGQQITFDPSDMICKYELSGSRGRLIYSVSLADFKLFGIFRIPFTIKITDGSNRNLHLEITDYRVDSPLNESVFSLTKSGE